MRMLSPQIESINFKRKDRNYKENSQIEALELKNMITKMKNLLQELNIGCVQAREIINGLENKNQFR